MSTEDAALATACLDIDLVPCVEDVDPVDAASSPVAKSSAGGAEVLVRIHGQPLARLTLEPDVAITRAVLLERLDFRSRARVTAHLVADGVAVANLRSDDDTAAALFGVAGAACFTAPARSSLTVTVVVCTLGREPLLEQCLQRLVEQDHAAVEIVVVDNDPGVSSVRATVEALGHPRLRYVAEPRRGLSFARNRGLATATGNVVAFTDDDAVPDVTWVSTLASAFDESPDVAAVTGLVVPLELETQAQQWFEEFGGFDKGYQRSVWHARDSHDGLEVLGERGKGGPAFPFAAGVVGSGNNMAFRAGVLEEIGGFDVALGAGTPSGGGEDLDAFVSVMLGDAVIVYEPRAVVHHRHRRDLADLESQVRAYGSGLSAMLAKQMLASPGRAGGVAVRVPAGLRRLLDPSSEKNARKSSSFPAELARIERRGFVAGPMLYARGRRAAGSFRDEAEVAAGAGGLPSRTAIAYLDLEGLEPGDVPDLDPAGEHSAAWVVVREAGRPLALVETALPVPSHFTTEVLDAAARSPHIAEPGAAEPGAADALSVSVVVPTIVAREDELAACLDSLTASTHPLVEVILVDNRPVRPEPDPLPAILATRPGVRLVHEPVKGISAARNAGVAAANGEIVAFTDDDVQVDPRWVAALASRFAARPDEQAVTGLILPAELETPAQVWFERYYGGFGGTRTFTPVSYGVEGGTRPWLRGTMVARDEAGSSTGTFPVYGAGVCGAGANMAFRRRWLLESGGFDVALGTGTRSRGGEDLAAFIDVLWSGGRIGYEPSAVVRHKHRGSYDELRTQMRGYGVGFTAMLTSLVASDPSHAAGLAAQLPSAAVRYSRAAVARFGGRRPADASAQSGPSYPAELARLEYSGYPRGPFAYAASRRAARDRRRPSE